MDALHRHSADDTAMSAAMPQITNPDNPDTLRSLSDPSSLNDPSTPQFQVPDLPASDPFTLTHYPAPPATAPDTPEDAEGATVLGPFQPEEFVTDPETNATYAHIPPAPDEDPDLPRHHLILRVTEQNQRPNGDLLLHCVDDRGDPTTYLVSVVPDNVLEAEL